VTLTFYESTTTVGWNAFRKVRFTDDSGFVVSLSASQILSLTALMLSICINCAVICRCYFCLLKTFFRFCPRPKNSVYPEDRQYSISSVDSANSLPITYQTSGSNTVSRTANCRLFQISNESSKDSIVIHYCKEPKPTSNIVVLDYATRGKIIQSNHGSLQTPAENFGAFPEEVLPDSGSAPGFTDISPGAELHRIQLMKNMCALRNQSWRRERMNVTSATKNSMVMMGTFVLCSFPLFFCSVPGILPTSSITIVQYPLLFSHLAFNINAPAYPIWYLIFSKRVRKCFQNLYEDILIKLNMK